MLGEIWLQPLFQWTWNLHTTLDVEGDSIHYQVEQHIWWPNICIRKLIALCKYMMESTPFHQKNSRRSNGRKVKALNLGQLFVFLLIVRMDHAYLWNLYVCMYVIYTYVGILIFMLILKVVKFHWPDGECLSQ